MTKIVDSPSLEMEGRKSLRLLLLLFYDSYIEFRKPKIKSHVFPETGSIAIHLVTLRRIVCDVL